MMAEIAGQFSMFEDNPQYDAFVDKFKPKLTTDDCYTPDPVYNAIADWVANEYGVNRADFVRPFWPGGDYQRFNYPDGCVVVDNPPFSIIAQIERFYITRGIKFFIFAPSLTLFSGRDIEDITYVSTYCDIVYENGAKVKTSFATNLDTCIVRSAPTLSKAVKDAATTMRKEKTVELPKYVYPDNIITAAMVGRWSALGIEYRLERKDAVKVSALDAQKLKGKTIFGSGFLISERAAAERAAAERAAAVVWELSPREMEIVKGLGK